ncbi:MAG: protein kinase [Acidobacteriota bacterium]|nr:protein kinase [Acidobacteriota bacterium]
MPITDLMVLPADIVVVPVTDLPEAVRRQAQAEEGDYALTRPRSRTPSRIIDANAAELLAHFRKPVTIVQAVIRYSREKKTDPERTLEEAFPLLERLAAARLLVPAHSEEAQQIQPSLEVGTKFGGAEILGCVQVLEDTELYQAKTSEGHMAALKVLRPNAGSQAARMFDREAAILERLDGSVSPKLLKTGAEAEQRYLLIEWCSGVDCSSAASELRRSGDGAARRSLLGLCGAILDAYARLHEQNVIHSDIHPRNVLVDGVEQVKLIDFGVARIAGVENEFRRTHRAGVAYFFEPEYAKAVKAGKGYPYSSARGEQYALAALIYFLITGNHYLDFSVEKHEMLRQIAEDGPLEFSRRGVQAWPELERVLAKALSKDPAQRFSSVAEFGERLRAVALPDEVSVPAPEVATAPAAYPDAEKMLAGMLGRLDLAEPLFAQGLRVAPKVSVTYGSGGVAYGLYRIACAREDARLLAMADLWATRAARDISLSDAFYCKDIDITPEVVGRVSPYHTESGVRLAQALIGRAMVDVVSQQMAVDSFIASVTAAPCENLDVTLGRSGTLLAAALLLDACSGDKLLNTGPLIEFGNQTLALLWEKIRELGPIRECREIQYSGAAHGWAGILYAIMSWCRSSETPLPAGVDERLDQLARLGEDSGHRVRWKWSTVRRHAEQMGAYMTGWCNGTAGFVFLWTLAHRMLGRAEYGALAEKAGLDASESEGPTGNLCCGYAGQAYALLNLYKHTGGKVWLHRAQALAQRAARSILEMPRVGDFLELALRPESLYKGELGVAVLAAELERPEFAAMPFFETGD